MVHITSTPEFQLALVGLILQVKQNLLSVAAEFDLSIGQAFSLLLIDAQQTRSMKDYCRVYSCDAGNLTGLIDGLEEKGLVVREQSQADRRIKVIRILPAGQKIQAKIIARLAEANQELFGTLSTQEQTDFFRVLQKTNSLSPSYDS